MALACIHSRALLGLDAVPVTVEVHLANGLPSFSLVGLADTEVKEARERVRCAIQNSGLVFPTNQRITVNLAPADLPKDSGRFDLPIALGILAASGQIDASTLQHVEFAGELSLSGALRPIRGALAMALAVKTSQKRTSLVLPPTSAEEAALVPDSIVYRAEHLLDVVAQFLSRSNTTSTSSTIGTTDGWRQLHSTVLQTTIKQGDLSEVKGQAGAKRALEIAAAGGHSVLMYGAPGSGKSMLAQRFAALLPPLNTEAALQTAAIHSLCGNFQIQNWGQRPTRQPHHSASAVALVGGGSPPRPGEISLAHHGVLFLDELPEFPRSALEALREPLESGTITIARAAHRAEFPAQFQLIAAMNPCPCGYFGSNRHACRCTADQIKRYQNKLSGPLMDRIDLHIEVQNIPPDQLISTPAGESTASIRTRCIAARDIAIARQGYPNHALSGKDLDTFSQIEPSAQQFLQTAAIKLDWSARSIHRTLKIARTIADLAGSESMQRSHVAEAMQYRQKTATT